VCAQTDVLGTSSNQGHVLVRGVEHGGSELRLVHVGVKITHPHTAAEPVRSLVDHNHPWDVHYLEVTVQFQLQEPDVLDKSV
jgi:hypothetical protein